ncbi:hypothetical protein BS78_02G144900 [Paspalum vaginatum]|nr:hypothetical protein BS78_02G144900 [Paspalum vaginatum]
MDFIEGLPTSNSKDVILVVVDTFTKYAHFIPLSHPYTAQVVVDLFLDHIFKLHEWWYNTSYHTSLNLTPFQALYGFPPPMVSEDISTDCPNLIVQEQLRNRQVAQQVIKDNLQKAQTRIKHQADKHRQERQFAIGDMVYLKIQPYRHTSLSSHRSLKLHSKYYGPFRVLEKIGRAA